MAIAMTFDDGPNTTTTPLLLDLLEELDVQVTFFVLGSMVQRNPSVLRRIARASQQHEGCNHSWSHTSFKRLSNDRIRVEIQDTHTAIADIIGAARTPRIVRPPYGAVTTRQREFISSELNYRLVGWNVDPEDWRTNKTSAQIAEHITTRTRDGQVILAHDIHRRTVDAMRDTLTALKARFSLVSVSRLGTFTTGGLAMGIEYVRPAVA